MKRKILNSFIICIIGTLLLADNKKEVKNKSSFSSGNEKSEAQFTNSDMDNIKRKKCVAFYYRNKNGYIIPLVPHSDVDTTLRNNHNTELFILKFDDDISIDKDTGFFNFVFNGRKYLYIPDLYHPVAFQAGSQTSVPYTQKQLQKLEDWHWQFFIKNISTSSFLTENTKNGEWKYDGKDIERFPIVSTPGQKYEFIAMPWVEGASGDGTGEWIEIEIESRYYEKSQTLRILNGYVDIRRPHLFKENNRIKEATLICTPENPEQEIFEKKVVFEDFVYVKKIELEKKCKKIRLRIDSVFKGSKYDDTAITSIYTDDTFYFAR